MKKRQLCFTIFLMATTSTTIAQRFTMKPLPYDADALAPALSRETFDYHYGKHYAGYVRKLNELTAESPFSKMTLEELIRETEGPLYNNAAQVWNHEFYFASLSPEGHPLPEGPFQRAVLSQFGSFEHLQQELTETCLSLFGSGWVWLVEEEDGGLKILAEPNAGNPLRYGMIPLLVIDLWEHAYYIDYRNDRAAALAALWPCIDWRIVSARYEKHAL